MILKGVARAHPEKNFISLRYFNPAGCHSSGKIGDWPSNYPGNLFPVIQEYILGRRKELKVYGLDYNTPDKSGVRDYIHVVDLGKFRIYLAQGHIKALQKLLSMNE